MKSRTKVAHFAAEALLNNTIPRDRLVAMLASWLKDTKNTRQSSYLVQDIARQLAHSGYVFITITTAHPITPQTKSSIVDYIHSYYGANVTLETKEVINPAIIGGVQIDTPNGSLDASVKRKLIQIIKGVQR